MCIFKKYRDIFGNPMEGLHRFRFLNLAIVDVLLTILGSYLISKYFKYSFIITLIIIFLLGIILHRLFCVRTTIDKLLFS
jgi:hypothetical protein